MSLIPFNDKFLAAFSDIGTMAETAFKCLRFVEPVDQITVDTYVDREFSTQADAWRKRSQSVELDRLAAAGKEKQRAGKLIKHEFDLAGIQIRAAADVSGQFIDLHGLVQFAA